MALLPFGSPPSKAGAVALPIKQAGSTVVASPTAINFSSGATVTNVGGVATVAISSGSLAVQDIKKDQVDSVTLYTGIAAKGTALSSATWTLLKYVLSGAGLETRTVSTATDSWNNHLTATYTSSNSYSV